MPSFLDNSLQPNLKCSLTTSAAATFICWYEFALHHPLNFMKLFLQFVLSIFPFFWRNHKFAHSSIIIIITATATTTRQKCLVNWKIQGDFFLVADSGGSNRATYQANWQQKVLRIPTTATATQSPGDVFSLAQSSRVESTGWRTTNYWRHRLRTPTHFATTFLASVISASAISPSPSTAASAASATPFWQFGIGGGKAAAAASLALTHFLVLGKWVTAAAFVALVSGLLLVVAEAAAKWQQ